MRGAQPAKQFKLHHVRVLIGSRELFRDAWRTSMRAWRELQRAAEPIEEDWKLMTRRRTAAHRGALHRVVSPMFREHGYDDEIMEWQDTHMYCPFGCYWLYVEKQ